MVTPSLLAFSISLAVILFRSGFRLPFLICVHLCPSVVFFHPIDPFVAGGMRALHRVTGSNDYARSNEA